MAVDTRPCRLKRFYLLTTYKALEFSGVNLLYKFLTLRVFLRVDIVNNFFQITISFEIWVC